MELLLLVYNWVTELVMREAGSLKENSARFHIRDQGRLEGKGDCGKWDIRRLTVNRTLILSMDPRLESMGEMVEEPNSSSIASIVLTAMVDFQHREYTDSTLQKLLYEF